MTPNKARGPYPHFYELGTVAYRVDGRGEAPKIGCASYGVMSMDGLISNERFFQLATRITKNRAMQINKPHSAELI